MSTRKKRRYRVKSHEYKAQRDLKANLRQISWKKIGMLALSFAVIFAIFRVGIYFEWKGIYLVYYILLAVSLGAWLWFNHGLGARLPDREDLNMPEEEKDAFIERLRRDKKIANAIVYILVPLLVTFAVDFIQLYWLDPIMGTEYTA